MKKWTLHIYIAALLASLLVSCSTILDEGIIQAQDDKVGITFTLSMNGVGAATRSLTEGAVTRYENTIDQDNFRVLAYTTDGNVHEVAIYFIEKVKEKENTYKISGELKGTHAVNKVVVLANCDKSFNPAVSTLDKLAYSYSESNFNPESPKSYIPMWGEKEIAAPLKQGESTDIGTIGLLRAMAKISVISIGLEELGCVTLKSVNNKGSVVPDNGNIAEAGEDLSATAPTIPAGVSKIDDVLFYTLNSKEAFVYLPEQAEYSGQNKLEMGISLGGKDYTLPFMDYRTSPYPHGDAYPVLRNIHYQYRITAKASDLDFKVEYEVVPWDVEKIEIGFN